MKSAESRSAEWPAAGFTLVEVLVVVAIFALLAGILLPSLSRARKITRSAVCLSNLRQFVAAAHAYAHDANGMYPLAYFLTWDSPCMISYAWDFTVVTDWDAGGESTVKAGLLWQGAKTIPEVHRCPSYTGGDNWAGIPHTGYNYNTSYIGHGSGEVHEAPAQVASVRRPSQCALFGDGEYSGGANKFMRAPWHDPENGGDWFSGRSAGSQGYRHLGKTNVAFCDGHAQRWSERYTENSDGIKPSGNTGFLSSDNRLYDLK